MAAMYLLKHPDHYTSHKFRACYWKGYIYEVMKAFEDSDQIEKEGKSKVMLGLKHGQTTNEVYAVTPVTDYTCRPVEYENVCLYDWIRLNEKKRIPRSKKARQAKKETEAVILEEVDDGEDDFENDIGEAVIEQKYHNKEEEESDTEDYARPQLKGGRPSLAQEEEESSDEEGSKYKQQPLRRTLNTEESEDELLITNKSSKKLEKEMKDKSARQYMFTPDHPQHGTHEVRLVPEEEGFVPNFIGGSLPRKDSGSREYYCMTMLTLFKPWRSGKDLRSSTDLFWDEEFQMHTFSTRDERIMKNFHIRYECNDARDDFAAQRKRLEKGQMLPERYTQEDLDEMDTRYYVDDMELPMRKEEMVALQHKDVDYEDSTWKDRDNKFKDAAAMLESSGWNLPSQKAELIKSQVRRLAVDEEVGSSEWKKLLDEKRQELIDARDAQADKRKDNKPTDWPPKNPEPNAVKLIGKKYFLNKKFRAESETSQ